MSNIKVSEMPEASELNNNDLLMIVQNGTNKKVKIEKLGISELQTNLQQQIVEAQTNLQQEISEIQTNLQQEISENQTNLENMCTYSTEEIDTGKKWTDGKPIYRTVLTISAITAGQVKSIDISSLNFERIVIMTAIGTLTDGAVIPIPYIYGGNAVTMYEENNNIRIASTGYNITNVNVIIEYVKNI